MFRKGRMLPVLRNGMSRHNMPAKFSKGLLKSPTLEAADNKKFGCFDEIFLCFLFGSALGGNLQWRTMGNVPAVFFFHHAEKLELCLKHYAHTPTPPVGERDFAFTVPTS